MSLPFGRGGRGLAMRQATPSEEKSDCDNNLSAAPGIRFGRGMPGRGLGLTKRVEDSSSDVSRGRGFSQSQSGAVATVGRGFSMSFGRGIKSVDISGKLAAMSISKESKETDESPLGDAPPKRIDPRKGKDAPEGSSRRRRVLEEVGPENKHGTVGTRAPMTANYIRVRCEQDNIYQYSVEFHPQLDARNARIRTLMRIPAEQFCNLPSEARAFDGRILCLPRSLSQRETIIRTTRPPDNTEVVMKITLTNKTPIVSCPAAYNIIFRRIQQELKMTQVGRHYYDPSKKREIGEHKLEVWPGYITTITAYEGGLLLMCDVSHKVIRKDTVHDIIKSIYNNGRISDQQFQQNCISQIVGQSVLTRYRNATYRIDDIDFKRHALSTFKKDGREITFASYFKEQYNIQIRDPNQPLLLHRSKKMGRNAEQDAEDIIGLIPELCYITGLTDEMRENFRLMKALHEHTRVTPQVRHQAMRKFLQTVTTCQRAQEILTAWGMHLETDTVSLEGRVLNAEKIKFGSGIVDLARTNDASFKRDLGRQKVLASEPIDSWLVICTAKDAEIVKEFLRTLQQRSRSVGMSIANPKLERLNDDRTESYLRVMQANMNGMRMVLAVFPTKRSDRYNAFKKITCVECPVPSQVVLTNTIRNPNKLASVATNICLQMNVKMGGELWAVHVPLKKFMVVGIDAYHHGKQRSKSVYGMCASLNGTCTQYYSRVVFQDGRGQEIGDKIQSVITDMLKAYNDRNHFLPDSIFFYRDGVGDSMLSTVQGYEIPQITRGFAAFGTSYCPKLVFNVVQKRINTRIFAPTGREMTNPKPGTIIDHTITRRDRYDFFLVPQSVNQGTVTPTHVVVLHDSSALSPNEIQQMAYKQCHLYYNWPGTIRVPACCLYAHKLAYLVGENIQKEPSQKLSKCLFFI